MYKINVFRSNDNPRLVAYANDINPDITIRDGVLIVHDVDDEYLIVPLTGINHVSVVKEDDDV